jgi:hypothetical protein
MTASKSPIDNDRKPIRAHGACEAIRNVEAVQWNNSAALRLYPIERRIFGAFRHGKDPASISLKQHFGSDVDKR